MMIERTPLLTLLVPCLVYATATVEIAAPLSTLTNCRPWRHHVAWHDGEVVVETGECTWEKEQVWLQWTEGLYSGDGPVICCKML